MRTTLSRLATAAKYLTAGNPTGLTGILTHPAPRAELVAIYQATLHKLSQLPAHSSYRNATENLTKYRLSQVESLKPEGWDEWRTKADAVLQQHPDIFRAMHQFKKFTRRDVGEKVYISERLVEDVDMDELTHQGKKLPVFKEGAGGKEDLLRLAERDQMIRELEEGEENWVAEPKLDAEQITQLEDKIGAGLIEEVIAVALGELQLVDTMLQAKVWEELEDKPSEGQWSYFERDRNVSGTQEPPKV